MPNSVRSLKRKSTNRNYERSQNDDVQSLISPSTIAQSIISSRPASRSSFKNVIKKHEGENASFTENQTPDENDRGNWSSSLDYLMSCIGFAVGLGNIWRFPYLVYEHGGGPFILAYFLFLLIVALPLAFMETAWGQLTSRGPLGMWDKICPKLKGTGVATVVFAGFMNTYYQVVTMYCLAYLFKSFQSSLPWLTCNNDWNEFSTCNKTEIPAYQYWKSGMLKQSEFIAFGWFTEGSLGVDSYLLMCLMISWVFILIALSRGIKSSGKVVYITTITPYIILLVFVVRGVTLPGASKGLSFLFGKASKWEKLAEADTWRAAATQIMFSLSVATGGLTTLSSYNKFNHNCLRDICIVAVVNAITSVLGGIAVFSILGHLAKNTNQDIQDLIESGFSLAFVAFPTALAQLPAPPVWAVLFFLMLCFLGFSSQFTATEIICTAVKDAFPEAVKSVSAFEVTSLVVLTFFLLSLQLINPSGVYWIHLMDSFASNWGLLAIGLIEVVSIGWIYGADKFLNDIEQMLGEKSDNFKTFWRIMWKFVCPTVMTVLLAWSVISIKRLKYGEYVYPGWANFIGWAIFVSAIVWILPPIFDRKLVWRRVEVKSLSVRSKDSKSITYI